ncbi:MAG TPA: SulP family inorganic anion transporter [Burkholderiaceae bacterium]|nr:SulP family inorganic anion transporter [Burkholderiaceae bacterium]
MALAHAPETAAYGLIAFAPLGPTRGPAAMGAALLGTVAANLIAAAVGGGRMVSGTRAALALLTAGLVAALSDAASLQATGDPRSILLWVGIGVAAAGVLQMMFGYLGLGTIAKYTPHPVRAGVSGGVGLLLIVTALPLVAGHPFGSRLATLAGSSNVAALLVGGIAFAVTLLAARRKLGVPPVLLGLSAAALCHWLIQRTGSGIDPGLLLDTPDLSNGWPQFVDGETLRAMRGSGGSVLALVSSYALTVAVLCSLDTLLTASIVDGHLRQHRDASRELVAQGLGLLACAGVGGQPVAPSIPRSLALLMPGRATGGTVAVYAAALLALAWALPGVIGLLPVSAIGGVLLLQGAQMVAPAFWRAPIELWRLRRSSGRPLGEPRRHTLEANWAVELAVALSAVILGLGPAVLIGAACAILLFVRANLRDVVRRQWSGQVRHSLKARTSEASESLKREGGAIALLELEGPLFFGTADGLRAKLESLEESVHTVILDLNQVGEIDVTGARILFETARHWEHEGRRLVFAEWGERDARRRMVEAVGTSGARLNFADTADLALEQAEDALLDRIRHRHDTTRVLAVGETMLGRDLDARELEILMSKLRPLRFARGESLFRVGDPGDSLYVSLQGDIGLRIPGGTRRLASFAAGIIVGEMGMLSRGVRSAAAVAESDIVAVKLEGDDFEELTRRHPELGAKLLRNISLQLAERVRALTGDLGHWMSRTAASGGPDMAVVARDEGESHS